jgi:hypothetical protein
MATTVRAPKNEVVHWSGFDACHFSTRRAKANAAFIVTAVNSHATLTARVEELTKALSAAGGYLRNASIDLSTGATKATAIRTIEGGLKLIDAVLEPKGAAV